MNRKSHQNTDNRKGIKKDFFNFRFHVTAFDILTFGVVMLCGGIVLGWVVDWPFKSIGGR